MSEDGVLTELPHRILETAMRAGMDTSERGRSASYFHVDNQTVYSTINRMFEGRIEMMDVKEAIKSTIGS